jgi:hypothetical protein
MSSDQSPPVVADEMPALEDTSVAQEVQALNMNDPSILPTFDRPMEMDEKQGLESLFVLDSSSPSHSFDFFGGKSASSR